MNKRWLRHHVRKEPPALRRLFLNEHLSASEHEVRLAIRQNPKSYAAHSSLSDLLMRRGRRREAIEFWHRTVRRFPGVPNPFFQRANWALEQRDFDAAQKYLRICLRFDRGYFRETAHFWRAEALARLGRDREAEKELARVPDGYEEFWFLDYERRTKQDLVAQLRERGSSDAL